MSLKKLMSKKHKIFCTVLNYIKHFLILASLGSICISISASTFLLDIAIGTTSSAIGLKVCAITAGIKIK